MTPIDIRPTDLDTIRRILGRHVPDVEVRAFGSRVAWNARETSDLDLALMTDEPLSIDRTAKLRAAFTDSDLPFRVDIVDWATASESFRKQIRLQSKPFVGAVDVLQTENGFETAPRWERRDVRDLIRDGVLVVGDGYRAKNSELSGSGLPFARAGNIADGFRFLGADRFPEDGLTKVGDKTSRPGDVVFTSKGTVGRFAFVRQDTERFVYSPQLCFWRSRDRKAIDPYFLYCWMRGPEFFGQFKGVAGQTDMADYVSLTDQRRMFVTLPPLDEQRAIAHVLGTLDDKIELNRRMNATLEAMARALFRSWFVDFDPVRAKMEGRDTGLPKEIADLFPDRLVDSELGEVPEGWSVGVLDDAVELLNGGTPRTSVARFWNGEIPWYTAKDAPAPHDVFVVNTERTITQAGVDNSATRVLPSGTTVISARGTVGRLACLGRPMAMNQTCYGIRGARGYGDFFTYWLSRTAVDELRSRTHGTIFDTITRQTFTLVDLPLPPVSLADAFESAAMPLMQRILSNLRESSAVAALRDALLPKLVSGQLRVTGLASPSVPDDLPAPVGTHEA